MIKRSLREKKEDSLIITRPSEELLEQGHVVSFNIRYDHRLGILTVHLRNIYGIPLNNPSSIFYVKSEFSSMSSITGIIFNIQHIYCQIKAKGRNEKPLALEMAR